jgi:hypothetical protein
MTTTAASKRRRFRSPATLWTGILLLALPVAYFGYHKYEIRNQGLDDFFVLLNQRGYTPNVGFSGVFRPGNVIQVAEQGAEAKDLLLATPLVVAWADKCFPGRSPKTLEFTLPQFQGQSSADLTLSGNMLSRMMPSLNLENSAVASYSLTLENTRIQTFAKTDLSSEFSAPCVAALRTAIDGGDRVEWLRVVLEAIVADALTLQVDWKDNASLETREKVANMAGRALTQTAASSQAGGGDSELKVAVTKDDTKKTTVSAKGFVIVGYRARPLQPVVAQ